MQLQIEVSDINSSMFLKLMETFKVGNIVNSYSIVSDEKEKETTEILEDIAMLDMTLKDAQKGLGTRTGRYVNVDDVRRFDAFLSHGKEVESLEMFSRESLYERQV